MFFRSSSSLKRERGATTARVSVTTVLLVCAVAAYGDSPSPTDRYEAALRAQIRRLPPVEHDFVAGAAYAGHYRLDRLVSFSNDRGRVFAAFHLPGAVTKLFRDPAPLVLSLEGSPHVWTLHRRNAGTLDRDFSMITLTCYAPDEPGAFNRYSLSSDGSNVMVAGAQMYGHVSTQQSIAASQGEQSVRITWRIEANRWERRAIELAALDDFATRAPNAWSEYLLPVLRRLGAARPAGDVYRVFDTIAADPSVVTAIGPLVARLGSDDPAARDAATAALRAMGPSAIIACLRIDTDVLSPEQATRLAGLYATDGWVHLSDVEGARRDPAFLTSCLEDSDPAVRRAAANLLAPLRAAKMMR